MQVLLGGMGEKLSRIVLQFLHDQAWLSNNSYDFWANAKISHHSISPKYAKGLGFLGGLGVVKGIGLSFCRVYVFGRVGVTVSWPMQKILLWSHPPTIFLFFSVKNWCSTQNCWWVPSYTNLKNSWFHSIIRLVVGTSFHKYLPFHSVKFHLSMQY